MDSANNADSVNNVDSANNANADIRIELVKASVKNTIHFHPDGSYGNFICKYSTYTANKKHTIWNLKYFNDNFMKIIPDDVLKSKKKLDDLADAFMMIVGWICKNDMLL